MSLTRRSRLTLTLASDERLRAVDSEDGTDENARFFERYRREARLSRRLFIDPPSFLTI
jgi:hypothetical protein